MQGIDLGEQAEVLTGVAPGEGPPGWAAAVADVPGRAVLGDEAGQLRSEPPAHLAREAAHHSLVGLARLPVPEPAKRLGNELVARAAVQGLDLDRLGAVEERANLVQGPYSVGLKHHDHLPMMPGSGPLQAHLTLESPVPLQAHVSLEKAGGCVHPRRHDTSNAANRNETLPVGNLTAARVPNARHSGRTRFHERISDGGTLFLQVTPTGAKCWGADRPSARPAAHCGAGRIPAERGAGAGDRQVGHRAARPGDGLSPCPC